MEPVVTPGTVIGRKYVVERVLGEGGMGLVVLATHATLRTKFAVKVMLPAYAASASARQRLMEEAQNASRIPGEHVVRVVDAEILPDGLAYLAMEYLEGTDLARLIETEGPLVPYDAAEIVIQACAAVIAAHAHSIVHRDLKPSNVFVTRRQDGSRLVKVLDFGLSKDRGDMSRPDLTRSLTMLGSPLYMSPEQIRDPRAVGPSTDIWSLGVVLFEALAGSPPFTGVTHGGLSVSISSDPLPDLHVLAPGTPEPLVAIVRRALEKREADRFPTVVALRDALVAVLPSLPRTRAPSVVRSGLGSASSPSVFLGETIASDASRTVPRSANRTPLLVIGLASAVFLLGVGGLAVALTTLRRSSPGSNDPPAATSPSAPPAAPPDTAAVPSATGPVVAPASASASAPAPARPAARPDARPVPTKVAPSDCNPPYTVDEKGHKIFKPQCL